MRPFLHSLAPSLLLMASLLPAQQTKVLPSGFDYVDGPTGQTYPFGRVTAAVQFLFDADRVTTQQGLLTGIRFRQNQITLAQVLPGHTKNYMVTCYTVPTMAAVMNANPTVNIGSATGTVVFNGPVSLPPMTVLTTYPPSFDIAIPFTTPYPYDGAQGNLLFVLETTDLGAVPGTVRLDGVTIRSDTVTGVSATMDDRGCVVGGQYLTLGVTATAAVVGGSITQTLASSSPGAFPAVMTGLSFTTQPQNLAAFGMPSCTSWLGPFVLQFVLETGGTYPNIVWSLPPDPYLEGVSLASQALGIAPSGLLTDSVTSNGVGTRIGANTTPIPTHMNMSFRTTSNWAMSAVGTSMPIIQLEGVFP